ncbi:MAG: hypothetical protein U7126_22565 [Microcoleus sp.]
MGHGAWGMGHEALGMGHGALGIGHGDYLVRESMAECPPPSLLQNRACDFHRTRLLSDVILVMDTVRSHHEMIYTA